MAKARKVKRSATKETLRESINNPLARGVKGKGTGVYFKNKNLRDEKERAEVVRELSNTIIDIAVNEIQVNRYQPRQDFDQEALEDLANSIRLHGIIQPITVRRLEEGKYELISGERRLRASRLAGLETVPAYIRLADDKQMMEMALLENLQREDLNPVEVATTYGRLIEEFEYTHEDFAARIKKGRSTVTNILNILKLEPSIKQSLKDREISMGHAKALFGLKDPALRQALHQKIVADDLSVRATESLANTYKGGNTAGSAAPAQKAVLPDEYTDVQNQLREFFGSKKVQIKVKPNGKGQIVIPFNDTRALNELLDKLED